MKTTLKKMCAAGLATFFTALGLTNTAIAAGYPERSITMIVAYAPGGGTDLVARLIAPYIEKYLGNDARIVVSNKLGQHHDDTGG